MIRLIDIALRRGTQLLFQNVNLDIRNGEKVGLVGDNGSGKTSLLMMLTGDIGIDGGDLDLRYSDPSQPTGRDNVPGFIARSQQHPASVARSLEDWLKLFED